MKIYMCVVCGWIYDEAAGLPDDGIAPGTLWADVPDDWRCPECNVGKADFVLCEVRGVRCEV
ncbi:rubredoxin [Acidovorax facilis]